MSGVDPRTHLHPGRRVERATVCEESKFETTRVDGPRGALAMPIQETQKEAPYAAIAITRRHLSE